MRTVHEVPERKETSEPCTSHDPLPLEITLVRLGLLFGVLTLLGAWWAAAISAGLVTVAVARSSPVGVRDDAEPV